MRSVGLMAFALALVGFGLLSLVSGDFAYLWRPVPKWIIVRPLLAYASGALSLACGAGLLWRRTLARASLVLTLYVVSSMLLLHAPRVASAPGAVLEWYALGELATVVAGAWILVAGAVPVAARGWQGAFVGERGVRHARRLFALALPVFGLAHFAYAQVTASMVPAFLPGHLVWAYLTGVAHIAAGLGILLGVAPRLAATLEATMVSTFLLAVNVPDLVRAPASLPLWSEVFVAAAIGGVALLVAHSYAGEPWLTIERPGRGRLLAAPMTRSMARLHGQRRPPGETPSAGVRPVL